MTRCICSTAYYVIYKGNIPATAVQLPLLFRVTSAKLSKYPEKSRANRKNPAVLSQQGRTQAPKNTQVQPIRLRAACVPLKMI